MYVRKLFAGWYYHIHIISKHTYSPADKTPISQVGVQKNKPRTKRVHTKKVAEIYQPGKGDNQIHKILHCTGN